MIKGLSTSLLLAIAAFQARGLQPELPLGAPSLMKAGLVEETNSSAHSGDDVCSGLSLSRGLEYTESSQNLLNVATGDQKGATPRPVLLFVAGESFTEEGTPADWAMRDRAMCLAARNGRNAPSTQSSVAAPIKMISGISSEMVVESVMAIILLQGNTAA